MATYYNGEQLQSIVYNRQSKQLTVTTFDNGQPVVGNPLTITHKGFLIRIGVKSSQPASWQIWMEDGKIQAETTTMEASFKVNNFDLVFTDGSPTPISFIPEFIGILDVRDARTELVNFGGPDDYEISLNTEDRGSGSELSEFLVGRVVKV